MLRILHGTSYDFIKYWKHAAVATIVFIVAGMSLLVVHHVRTGSAVNWNVEFTGGTFMQVSFKQKPDPSSVRDAVSAAGFKEAEVAEFGSDTAYSIRASAATGGEATAKGADSAAAQIETALHRRFGDTTHVRVLHSAFVGSVVGAELKRDATIALLLSFVVTLIYLAIRFEWRFGLAAVIATAHDVLTTLAFIAMLRLEVSLTVVAAILTVIGYSLNDTIIIFDRLREDLKKHRKEPLRDTLNRAINETLPRSILTHATALSATLALLFFAGEIIRPFSWVMAFGIFTGTFSSIYVAGAILVWIEQKWPRASGTDTPTKSAQGRGSPRPSSKASPAGAGSR
jgi:preprotein translocase subunit SecF